jgi:hypothetical protein
MCPLWHNPAPERRSVLYLLLIFQQALPIKTERAGWVLIERAKVQRGNVAHLDGVPLNKPPHIDVMKP